MGETYAVPRLGIPSMCLNDGPAGLRLVKNVTGFPTGINTASTFSRRLMRARGEAMAEEFRGKGVKYVSMRSSHYMLTFLRVVYCWVLPWISYVLRAYSIPLI